MPIFVKILKFVHHAFFLNSKPTSLKLRHLLICFLSNIKVMTFTLKITIVFILCVLDLLFPM